MFVKTGWFASVTATISSGSAGNEWPVAKKITPPGAARSGSEMQHSASKFARFARAVMSDNAYLYEQVPRGNAPADADSDPYGSYRPPEQPTLRGLIGTLDVATLELHVARFQRTDATEFEARSAGLDAAGGQTEPVSLLADISMSTLPVSTAPVLEAAGKNALHRLQRLAPGGHDEFCSILTNCKLAVAGSEGLWDALLHYHASGSRAVTAASAPEVLVLVIAGEGAEALRPVHRVVRNLPGFQAGEMVRVVRENFFFEDVTRSMPRLDGSGPHFDPETARELLRPLHAGEVTMLAITAHSSFRLHSEAGWADTVLAHLSPKLRECASVQLHEVILDRRLGVPYRTRHNGLQESSDHVLYESDMATAARAVANGANVAFVMGVPNPALLLDIAGRDELLPARSAELDLDLPGLMNHVVG